MDITPYLELVVDREASDLFVIPDARVKIKVGGVMRSVGKEVLSGDACKESAYRLMGEAEQRCLEETKECDFAIELPDAGTRFRVNVYYQRGGVSMVLRRIPSDIPTLESLSLPGSLGDIVMRKNGMVLMAGATGSGKSTTLAAMLNHRNRNVAGHILTIEDPIEFRHPNFKSVFSQREVGVDTHSYANALRASLREAPDVILIGEIRDRETMEAVLELSNTGHLVLSTLHANNSSQAVERIVNMFPHTMHKQLFMDMSLNLRAIISQRLVRQVDGSHTAAMEIMVNGPHLAELLLRGDVSGLKEAMDDSSEPGMRTFDISLYELYKEGIISMDTALENANSMANLETHINFG